MRGADEVPHNNNAVHFSAHAVGLCAPPQVALNFVGMDDRQRPHCCNHGAKSSTDPQHPQSE